MIMNTLRFTISFLVLLFFTSFKLIDKRKMMAEKENSIVSYTMRHPLHEWEAISKDVNCAIIYNSATDNIESVAVVLKVDSFDSKNANRDSHALEVLEALKFPKVTFVANNIEWNGGDVLLIKGNLTFHGIVKPINIRAERKMTDGKLTIEGFFKTNLSEFKIERPTLLGLAAEDEIKMYFMVVFIV